MHAIVSQNMTNYSSIMTHFGVSKDYLDKIKGDDKEEQAIMSQRFVTGSQHPRWVQEYEEMAANGSWASLAPLQCTALP